MDNETVMCELLEHAETAQAEERPVQGPVSTDAKPKKGKVKKAATKVKAKAKKTAKSPKAKPAKKVATKSKKAPEKAPATGKRTYTRTGQFIGILIRLPLETMDAIDKDADAKGIVSRSEWARQTINKKLGIKS